MNKYIKYLLGLVTLALAVGCEVNDYNEEYLDGYVPSDKVEIEDIQNIELTLQDADYAAIANNKRNKEIAKLEGEEAEKALAAVASTKSFSEAAPAEKYLPAFLSAAYDVVLTNGSSVDVTYKKLKVGVSKNVSGVMSSKQYELTAEDYKKVWGEDNSTAYFTPEKSAKLYLPKILKESHADAKEGDYVIAKYQYSDYEPQIGGGSEGDGGEQSAYTPIKDLMKGANVTVKGHVAAAYGRGYMLADETGAVLVYLNKANNFALGDIVELTGEVGEFNSGLQFSASAEAKVVGKTKNFAFPKATPMTGAQLTEAVNNISCQYISVKGKLSISGFYYNLTIEGADFQGSLDYVIKGTVPEEYAGQNVEVTGYLFSVSKDRDTGKPKYAKLMMTSIALEGQQPQATAIGVVASQEAAAEYTVVGQVAAKAGKNVVVTDGTGSILAFFAEGAPELKVGDVVKLKGAINPHDGFNQFKSPELTVLNAESEFSAPAAKALTTADIDALGQMATVQNVAVSGVLKKNDKNYYELTLDGPLVMQKSRLFYENEEVIDASLLDKAVVVEGYLIGFSESYKSITTLVTSVKAADAAAIASLGLTRAQPTKTIEVVYSLKGGSWEPVEDCLMVTEEELDKMGFSKMFPSFKVAQKYLPMFLKNNCSYAFAEDVKAVVYYYSNDDKATLGVTEFVYNGEDWNEVAKTEELIAPFVKVDGKWVFNPSKTIVLNPDKGELSKLYYQAGADWVAANKHEAYTTDNRDNTRIKDAEYYSGLSAKYTNLNWRINTLPKYYWVNAGEDIAPYAGYEDKDSAVSMKAYENFYTEAEKRFAEVMTAVLNQMHGDVKMIEGSDILYRIQMMLYTTHIKSSTGRVTHEFTFKLVSDGVFEYQGMKALEPEFELMNPENFK